MPKKKNKSADYYEGYQDGVEDTVRKRQKQMSEIGSMGGAARAAALTPEQRREIAAVASVAGGKARAKALTKKQRSEIARKAVAARWAKARGE